MSLEQLINSWRSAEHFHECIQAWKNFPARSGEFFPIPDNLHPTLTKALHSVGINSLYSHQVETWNLAAEGKNVVIVTGTASGKTLCYNIPVLDCLLRDNHSRAIYLFPTKALSQDQAYQLNELSTRINLFLTSDTQNEHQIQDPNELPHLRLGIYDGDTPSSERIGLRSQVRVLITNPDMLHLGILPHHTLWAEFFNQLRYVVIDEIHTYRGIFGSHVANVIRRLKRVAGFYGCTPQFLMTSATIANPLEHAQKLIEQNVHLVRNDGSPKGEKHFVIYNPPIVDRILGLRRNIIAESADLAADLISCGAQTIVFGRSRRAVELLVRSLRNKPSIRNTISAKNGQPVKTIRGYRSGYLPRQRREIEKQLRQGIAQLVVATNALELGIDIGEMNAALLVGYPGSIASTLQQSGRAGRKSEVSLSILVTAADPLNQFIARHPEFIFEQSPEHALINPDNLLLLLEHIRCAAFELPFSSGDNFGEIENEQVLEFLQLLENQGVLHFSGQKFFWMSDQYPQQKISLRNMTTDPIILKKEQDGLSETIGTVDRYSSYWMVHPGAIYFHESESYFVKNLDLDSNQAFLLPTEADYYTEARQETHIELLGKLFEEIINTSSHLPAFISYGNIMVTTQVIGFKKIKQNSRETLTEEPLNLPAVNLATKGCWFTLTEEFVSNLRQNTLWLNDSNNYGSDWQKIKSLVRQRDGYHCRSCGAPENDRAHDIHHIIPFRSFANSQEANRMDNLITLCPRCHQQAEMNTKIRSGLAGLAYIFRHLAPFFLMCDEHDIGVYSDPKSQFAEKLPIIMIFDQFPDGIGLSQKISELHPELIKNALDVVSHCGCSDGCPACVGPGGENGLGGKKETLAILDGLS